jgi:hypothetical protein
LRQTSCKFSRPSFATSCFSSFIAESAICGTWAKSVLLAELACFSDWTLAQSHIGQL